MPAGLLRSVLLLWLLVSSGLLHAEEEPTPFSHFSLDLNNLNPAWWEGYVEADAKARETFFRRLESALQPLESPPLDKHPDRALILLHIEALKTLTAKPLDEVEVVPPAESYQLDGWRELMNRELALEQQIAEIRQRLHQLKTSVTSQRQEISALLLRYRDMKVVDPQRLPSAVALLRKQLELLQSLDREARNKRQENQFTTALTRYNALVDDALQRVQVDERAFEALLAEKAKLEQAAARLNGSSIVSDDLTALATVVSSAELDLLMGINGQLIRMAEALREGRVQDSSEIRGLFDEYDRASRQSRNRLNQLQEALLNDEAVADRGRYQQLKRLQTIRKNLSRNDSLLSELRLLTGYADQLVQRYRQWWEAPADKIRLFWTQSGVFIFDALNYPLFSINESPVSTLNLFWLIAIISIAVFISRQLRNLLMKLGGNQAALNDAAIFTVTRILHYVIMLVAVIMGLSSIGLDLSNLALVAGALSVGIGFGLQSIFSNFISGLILLFERPFKVGDLVELESGVRGRIRAINVRSTHINTSDNIDILVPNSEFIGGRVTNYTLDDDIRRLHVPFGVAYGSDKELVKRAALEAAEAVPWTMHEENRMPDVWLLNFGESSLDFELIVWIHYNQLPRGYRVLADYVWALETSLARHGLEIPFPQRDLHLRSVDDRLVASLMNRERG